MCGIAGVWFPKEARENGVSPVSVLVRMTAGQQHRGHEGAGVIMASHGTGGLLENKDFGLVYDVFTPLVLKDLEGDCGISHNRYSTTGGNSRENIQPFKGVMDDNGGAERIAVAHNGNLTSALNGLRPTTSDTWCILRNFGYVKKDLGIERRIYRALKSVSGSFSLVFVHQGKDGKTRLICARDPHGIRPLWLAKYKFRNGAKSVGYLVASETCAFDTIRDAEVWRPVRPGEIVVIDEDGVKTFTPPAWRHQRIARCIFELIYFMHPSSLVETSDWKSHPVFACEVQFALGKQLARENLDLQADGVVAVPDSANIHTDGFCAQSCIPLVRGILRRHSAGRTFIAPGDRTEKIIRKFTFLPTMLRPLSTVVLGDDSLVRGLTTKELILALRRSVGPDCPRIVVAIFSPPIIHPCFMGINTSTRKELAWNEDGQSIEGVRQAIGADGLKYLSLKGLLRVVESCGCGRKSFCTACFTGNYPVSIERKEYQAELS